MKKTLCVLFGICSALVLTLNAFASVDITDEPPALTDQTSSVMDANVDEYGFVLDLAAVPEDTQVLVTLAGSNSESIGTLNVYRRETRDEKSYWVKELATFAAYGENGLYKTREGDKKTPVGTFKMNTPFGIKAALDDFPENYIQVDSGHYWDGDSDSAQYNKLVNTEEYNDFDRSKSEHIINYAGYYNYAVDIGYNSNCIPYAGSAIYLHCYVQGDNDTAGCVAIPETDMIRILQLYEEGETWMVIYDKQNPSGVY